MKRYLFSAALLAACSLPALAGTDTEPMATHHHDGKDMKDVKQMAPASESDAGFYVAGFGGANFDTDYGDRRQTTYFNGTLISDTHHTLQSNWGGVGGLKFGYDFNSMPLCNFMDLRLQPAVEAEALYIGNTIDGNFTSLIGLPASQHYSSNSADFFVNGILRFKNKTIVTPYVGVGVGLQYVTLHGDSNVYAPAQFGGGSVFHTTGLNGTDVDFAAQALFGFDVAVCQHISIFTEYKFIDALGTDIKMNNLEDSNGLSANFKPDQIMQNLITAGVKYSF